jgi:hypothetical protein
MLTSTESFRQYAPKFKFNIPYHLGVCIGLGCWTSFGVQPGHYRDLGKSAARKLSKEDDSLQLLPPPFKSIEEAVSSGSSFWGRLTNLGEIDYSKTLIIADFGPGSDSPIVLYYDNPSQPSVMYLQWDWDAVVKRHVHKWTKTHASFRDFALDIGILPEADS